MKKTLITLAALALASVVQATELNFATAKDGDSVEFVGTAADKIILVGETTLDGNTMSYGTVDVTVNGPLFHNQVHTNGVLNGATIDFGTSGQLTMIGKVNFGTGANDQNLTFSISLPDLFIETDDASQNNKLVYTSRTLYISTEGSEIWNNEYVDYVVTAADGTTTTYSGRSSHEGGGVWDGETGMDSVGDYTFYAITQKDADENPIGVKFDIRYVSQYRYVDPSAPAVPEPATATLSLLALAGLAARRRRK